MGALCWAAAICIGAGPAAGPAHFVWPRPQLVEEIDIPAVVKADGVPVRLHVIRSKMGIEELLQTYATAFEQAGFYIALKQKRIVAEPHITALDWRTRISYSAIFSPNADGTTSCLFGEAAMGKQTAVPASDFAALMPAAREVMRIDQEADRVISFSVKARVDEVNQFYRETLTPVGFLPGPAEDEANLYGKGDERIRVIATPRADGMTTVVLMHRRSDR